MPEQECPHENVSVTMVWDNGKCISSRVRCDDCQEVLKKMSKDGPLRQETRSLNLP